MKFRIIQYANIPEASEMLKYSLEQLGHPTTIELGNAISGKSFDYTIVIRALKSVFPPGNEPKILFQTEELWNRREKGHYDVGSNFIRVLEMFKENVEIPTGTKNVVHCPVGYTPTYSMEFPEPEERDIDVFFYGSMTPRRQNICKELKKRLPDRKIICKEGIWGKEREEVIMRSKIVLNIKARDKWGFTPIHNLPAIANKRFCLIEKPDGDYGLFKKDVHFKEYKNIDGMIKSIEYWIENEKERKDFEQKALEDVIENCWFTPILKRSLKGII